jgi:hypothetical protein
MTGETAEEEPDVAKIFTSSRILIQTCPGGLSESPHQLLYPAQISDALQDLPLELASSYGGDLNLYIQDLLFGRRLSQLPGCWRDTPGCSGNISYLEAFTRVPSVLTLRIDQRSKEYKSPPKMVNWSFTEFLTIPSPTIGPSFNFELTGMTSYSADASRFQTFVAHVSRDDRSGTRYAEDAAQVSVIRLIEILNRGMEGWKPLAVFYRLVGGFEEQKRFRSLALQRLCSNYPSLHRLGDSPEKWMKRMPLSGYVLDVDGWVEQWPFKRRPACMECLDPNAVDDADDDDGEAEEDLSNPAYSDYSGQSSE